MSALAPRQSVEMKLEEIPPPSPFEVGSWVRVIGLHGLFRVLRGTKDGAVTVYGGAAGRASTRTFVPEKIRLATRAEIRNGGKS